MLPPLGRLDPTNPTLFVGLSSWGAEGLGGQASEQKREPQPQQALGHQLPTLHCQALVGGPWKPPNE